MSSLMSWILAPLILFLSVPLTCFAIGTTIFAFWILYVRLVILHFEMAYAILRSFFVRSDDWKTSLPPPPPLPEVDQYGFPKRQRRRSSSSGRVALAVHAKKSQSFAGLRHAIPDKDFEGLGGWFLSSSDEDDGDDDRLQVALSGLKTQPDSPISGPSRREKPSFMLGGSQQSSGRVSPELVRTPMLARNPGNRNLGSVSGTASPESYFNVPISSSLTALSAIDRERYPRVGFDMSQGSAEDRRRSRNNSVASLASVNIMMKRRAS